MHPPALLRLSSLASACVLLAAGGPARASEAPAPAPVIIDGSVIYTANCATCHNRGKAGAPRVSELAEWEARLKQGRDTLLKHALNGYSGPAGDEMPARGGNDDLTDAEVAAAVDHILLQLKKSKSTTP